MSFIRCQFMLLALFIMGGCEQSPMVLTSVQMGGTGGVLCAEAEAYISACTDNPTARAAAQCNPVEAELLLSTPCEVLQAAATGTGDLKADSDSEPAISLLCLWFGMGCPADTSCLPTLSDTDYARLVELSEPESLELHTDAQYRVNEIARIFREAGDPRGLFATVYRLITNRAVESVEAGDYAYPDWARRLIVEFARRYLRNLHGHLSGDEVTGQWAKYYDLAQNCRVGRGRTLGTAIAVHLMVDLPYTLHGIGSMPDQREDFVLFGDILLEIFPQLIIDVGADYDTDVYDLLNGFFLGKWVDSVAGEGTTTAFIYQGVRLKAWRDSQNLRIFPKAVVDADILTAWGLAEKFLAKLDASGVL